ncbi:MAG: flagellar protein FliS, partial [Gammaproteobacteria bacterium]|nr:flagellar protein FliS [Gammaproteobacteria bacterium]
ALYDFVNRKLSEANVETSVAALDEAAKVMKELEAGWNEIRPQAMAASANELSSA